MNVATAESAAAAVVEERGGSTNGALFPVTHSILATESLIAGILVRYDVGEVTGCQLHHRGLTDTYIVKTSRERYALRVYRAGWRSDGDVLYELDALSHLDRRGVAVSHAVADREGRLMQVVHAPEGRRQVVLFSYAPGAPNGMPPNADRSDYPYVYGRAVAAVHSASDDFSSPHARFSSDLHELMDRQLAPIGRMLEDRPDDWAYVQGLSRRLHERAERLPLEALGSGFCHGDFHGGNCHVEGDVLTFFDFDCCGVGWRSYDLAVFLWGHSHGGKPRRAERQWREFLRGYREVRPLASVELEAVTLFVAVRHFWVMGLHAENGRDWGYAWMNVRYFDRHLKFLREWEDKRLGRPVPRTWRR